MVGLCFFSYVLLSINLMVQYKRKNKNNKTVNTWPCQIITLLLMTMWLVMLVMTLSIFEQVKPDEFLIMAKTYHVHCYLIAKLLHRNLELRFFL